jgi:hypothetical protein
VSPRDASIKSLELIADRVGEIIARRELKHA